jgi:hypothetical protein
MVLHHNYQTIDVDINAEHTPLLPPPSPLIPKHEWSIKKRKQIKIEDTNA